MDLWLESVSVILFALLSALLAEGISYVLVYRTERYQRLKDDIARLTETLDQMKDKPNLGARQKIKEKKQSMWEESLAQKNKDMASMKFRSTFFVGAIFMFVFYLSNKLFGGRAIAKLPFEPFAMIQRLTHRNVPGEDFTDCSVAFLYALCSMGIRTNIQKFLGFAPPRNQQNPFFPMEPPKQL